MTQASPHVLPLLWLLYFVQGLPFGFQITAIPLLLRERGATLFTVTLSGALALPWLLKPLMAPWVDAARGSARRGRRRRWILPLQALLAAGWTIAGVVAGTTGEPPMVVLAVLVVAMNLAAAVMDIAVDGLAIDLLRPTGRLGPGNAAQVVGYKLGMLTGGGLWLVVAARVGMAAGFFALAALVAVVGIATYRFREPRQDGSTATSPLPPVREVVVRLGRALVRRRGSASLIAVVFTYKLGESMADRLFKLFVFDAGYDKATVGLWVDGWGMGFSIAGSLVGGWLVTRAPHGVAAVAVAAVARVVPLAAQWALAASATTAPELILAVTSAEHFCGGALTTTVFALMMARVDPSIGATHYTALATVEVLGKVPGGWLSGYLGDTWGYAPVFALATGLSVAFLGLLVPLHRGSGSLEPHGRDDFQSDSPGRDPRPQSLRG
ncbi:MAG: MFS transporter [Myxococcota bacterium]